MIPNCVLLGYGLVIISATYIADRQLIHSYQYCCCKTARVRVNLPHYAVVFRVIHLFEHILFRRMNESSILGSSPIRSKQADSKKTSKTFIPQGLILCIGAGWISILLCAYGPQLIVVFKVATRKHTRVRQKYFKGSKHTFGGKI